MKFCRKDRILLFSSIIGTIFLLFLFIRKIDLLSTISEIKILNIFDVLLFLLLCLIWCFFISLRFRLLIISHAKPNKIPSIKYFINFYIKFFRSNVFFPGHIGLDLVKLTSFKIKNISKKNILTLTLFEKIYGLSVVTSSLFIWLLCYFLNYDFSSYKINFSSSIIFIAAILSLTFICIFLFHFFYNLFIHIRYPIIIKQKASTLFLISTYSIILHLLGAYMYFTIFKALNIDMPIFFILFVVPLIFVATSLPISVGGLGMREFITVYLVSLIGIKLDVSGSIALSFAALNLIAGSFSFLYFILQRIFYNYHEKL